MNYHDEVLYGMILYMIWDILDIWKMIYYDVIWYDAIYEICCDLIYDVMWCMMWCDMIWYAMIWKTDTYLLHYNENATQ